MEKAPFGGGDADAFRGPETGGALPIRTAFVQQWTKTARMGSGAWKAGAKLDRKPDGHLGYRMLCDSSLRNVDAHIPGTKNEHLRIASKVFAVTDFGSPSGILFELAAPCVRIHRDFIEIRFLIAA